MKKEKIGVKIGATSKIKKAVRMYNSILSIYKNNIYFLYIVKIVEKMNTFTIKECNGTIFDRICHSPPSVEDITLILAVLEKYDFKTLGCSIEIIQGNNHRKTTGVFDSADIFFDYFKNLCKEGIKYGIVMYLNY